ncbi:MAG TPA: YjgN family protein [Terriglobia bacterium]|nr:YjgN family protein [Terriglobia bacterium]
MLEMQVGKPAPVGAAPVQKLTYHGRIGPLYGIFIKIWLLNVVTLTIYRFWGKANLRRYIWSQMDLQGERLEYTGTGGELFQGFLIVVGLFIVVQIVLAVLAAIFGPESLITHATGILFGFSVLFLSMVAVYAAQRYRLTRTTWRGIRGGMSGSAWAYGLRALGYNLLIALTLGLATPWVQMRLAEQRINNSYFGDAKALLEGKSASVYGGFILGFLLYVGLTAAFLAALWFGFDIPSLFAEMRDPHQGSGQSDPAQLHMVLKIFGLYFGFLIGMTFIGIFAFSWYAAAFFRALADGLSFDNLTFRSAMGASNYFWLWTGNILIYITTLGLGLPIVVHRSLRFFADRLEIIGVIDVDRLRQNTLPVPKTGEGLLETFDPGIW